MLMSHVQAKYSQIMQNLRLTWVNCRGKIENLVADDIVSSAGYQLNNQREGNT